VSAGQESDAVAPIARPSRAPERVYVRFEHVLLAGDCAWEALGSLARRPKALFGALTGDSSATLRARLVRGARLDPSTLPYRAEVLAHLEVARAAGQRVVLVAATDPQTARGIADHLGIFDAVLLVEPERGDGVEGRRAAILRDAGGHGFEYVGHGPRDLPIWRESAKATVVSPGTAEERALTALPVPRASIGSPRAGWRPLLRALRPHQWSKNALLFAPLTLAHLLGDRGRLTAVAVAFVSFCCVASATYVLNDLLDLESDRRHPRKRSRPFASGALSIPSGLALGSGMFLLGFGLSAALLPLPAVAMLALYAALTIAYSLALKEQLFLDVLVLAGLYTLRVIAGGVAGTVAVSPWLLAFSVFFFLSLAFLKRYIELIGARARLESRLPGRGYEVDDLGLVETMGTSSGYLAILVLCLYVSNADVHDLYRSPDLLWAMCPLMLFWVTRIWFLARRGLVSDDPVLFAAKDRTSLVCAALVLGIVALATVV